MKIESFKHTMYVLLITSPIMNFTHFETCITSTLVSYVGDLLDPKHNDVCFLSCVDLIERNAGDGIRNYYTHLGELCMCAGVILNYVSTCTLYLVHV